MAFVHEIEAAFQRTAYQAETTFGTAPTGSYVNFGFLEVTPAVKQTREAKTYKGSLLPSYVTNGKEYTEWEVSGDASFEELPLFVKDLVSDAPSTPTSYTLEHAGLAASGCVTTGWTIEGDMDNVTLKANLIGGKISTKTASTATSLASGYLFNGAKTAISINSVGISKCFKWSLSVSDLWSHVFYIGDNEPSTVAQTPAKGSFSCTVPAESTYLAFLENVGSVPVVITNTETIGGFVYLLKFEFAMEFEEPEKFAEEGAVYALGLKGQIMNKATKAITVTCTKTAAGG